MEAIKISIITINLNNQKGLVQTLNSVAQQTYSNTNISLLMAPQLMEVKPL